MIRAYIQKLARLFEHTRIAKNATVLLVSQIFARGLGIVYIAMLARYVHAEGIGQISTATALNGILMLVIAPGLNTLMIRDIAANRDKTAVYITNIMLTKLLFGLPYLLLVFVISAVAGYSADTIVIIRVYAIVYLFDALGSIFVACFEAYEQMEFEALSLIVQTSINVLLSLIAIHLRLSLIVIVACSLIAQICKFLFMLSIFNFRISRLSFRVNLDLMRSLLNNSLSFGMLLILSAIKLQSQVFILSLFRPQVDVGIYSAANSLIIMLLFVPMALSTAIFPAFSRMAAHSLQELRHFYQISFKYLLLIGFPLGLGTILIGDKVILLIYGNDFSESIPIIRILALFLFTVVGYSNGPLLKTIGKQNFLVWTEGAAVLINILLCLWLVPLWGTIGAAWAFVTTGILTFVIHSWACHHYFHVHFPWGIMGKIVAAITVMGIVILIFMWLGIPWLVYSLLLAPASYCLFIGAIGLVKRNELAFLATADAITNVAKRVTTEEGATI